MTQIDEKKYDMELQSMGISDILKLAIAFHGKEVIMEWKQPVIILILLKKVLREAFAMFLYGLHIIIDTSS